MKALVFHRPGHVEVNDVGLFFQYLRDACGDSARAHGLTFLFRCLGTFFAKRSASALRQMRHGALLLRSSRSLEYFSARRASDLLWPCSLLHFGLQNPVKAYAIP